MVLLKISGHEKNSGMSSLTSDVDVLQDRQHPSKSSYQGDEYLSKRDGTTMRCKMNEGSYQKIVGRHSRNDLTAKLCAWMCRVPDESNNEGQLPATSNGCRRETFLLLGSHQDHCSKIKLKESQESKSNQVRFSIVQLTDIYQSTAPICPDSMPLLAW